MRQTEIIGANVRNPRAGASNNSFRLNPAKRSHEFRMEFENSVLVGQTNVRLDNAIVFEGKLKCGIATRVASTSAQLRGVAARLSISNLDEVVAEIVLLHRDPSLHMPVARSNDMEELAADWQMWARRFNLPLVLIEPDGVEQLVSQKIGALDVMASKARRPHSHFMARRPRFLKRRKTGAINTENLLSGREIIARD